MGRSHYSGPLSGNYHQTRFEIRGIAASQADQLIGNLTFETPVRLVALRWRVTGTGGLSAFKARRTADQNARVVVGDTQVLSADGTTLAAANQVKVEPSGTTPTLDGTQRNFTRGQQLGLFASSDATVGNRDIEVTVIYYTTGDCLASDAND